MILAWSVRSETNLKNIAAYIAKDDPTAALRLVNGIIDRTAALLDNPKAGRPGRAANTRELIVHKNYIVVYRVAPDAITILTVRRTSRLWPSGF